MVLDLHPGGPPLPPRGSSGSIALDKKIGVIEGGSCDFPTVGLSDGWNVDAEFGRNPHWLMLKLRIVWLMRMVDDSRRRHLLIEEGSAGQGSNPRRVLLDDILLPG